MVNLKLKRAKGASRHNKRLCVDTGDEIKRYMPISARGSAVKSPPTRLDRSHAPAVQSKPRYKPVSSSRSAQTPTAGLGSSQAPTGQPKPGCKLVSSGRSAQKPSAGLGGSQAPAGQPKPGCKPVSSSRNAQGLVAGLGSSQALAVQSRPGYKSVSSIATAVQRPATELEGSHPLYVQPIYGYRPVSFRTKPVQVATRLEIVQLQLFSQDLDIIQRIPQ